MEQDDFKAAYDDFAVGVYALLNGTANEKGYASQGSGRALIDSVAEECGEGHALGEIRYKLVRWRRKRNPEDLQKIAAWAFLEYDRHHRRQAASGRTHYAGDDCPGGHLTPQRRGAKIAVK